MFSPSSLAALELCPRKFAWDKVDQIPREPNEYAAFGVRVHKILESYYLEGVMPDLASPEGNCATALLSHLPPPQPGMRVEEHRIVGRFHGYPDLTLGNRVWDHKTTSDHKWAKTDLAGDLQAALYAHFVMAETGEPRVTLQWNYVTRHKPRVLPVIQVVTHGDLARTVDRAHALADQGDRILDGRIPALDLPPNPSACDAYGGCQHRLRCALTPAQHMEAHLNKDEDMTNQTDFLKTMQERHGAPAQPWDGLPDTHVTSKQWYNAAAPGGPAWVDKVAAAPPPPPPPAVVPINPPPPAAVAPPAPPPPPGPPPPPPPAAAAPEAPSAPKKRGRPTKAAAAADVTEFAPAPDPPRVPAPPWDQIAAGLELIAEALRRA